jgi:hypothetical protein
MERWVGPAIVAALISSAIGLLGLYVNAWLTIRLERRRRKEKIRDVQIALLSEIRADIHNLRFFDLDDNLAMVRERYGKVEGYVARPTLSPPLLLEGMLKSEVQTLPAPVIDAVFLYARQKAAIDLFVQDLRGPYFETRSKETQLLMYSDYIEMKKVELKLALNARDTIEASLDAGLRD